MDFQLPYQVVLASLVLAVALVVYGVILADPEKERRFWRKAGRVLLGMSIASSGIGIVLGLALLNQL